MGIRVLILAEVLFMKVAINSRSNSHRRRRLAKPSSSAHHSLTLTFKISTLQLLPYHHHVIHPDSAILQPRPRLSGSVYPILRQSILFFLRVLLQPPYFFWPQKTTPPEIPQAVTNPVIVQPNHTRTIYRLGIKIWVRINVLCAFFF